MRTIFPRAVAGLAAVVLLASQYPVGVQAQPQHSPRALFTFGRQGGNIRPFDVTIDSSGHVSANGAVDVGTSPRHLSSETLKGLQKLAKAERFYSLPDSIRGSGVNPDVASLYITASGPNGPKTVKVHGAATSAFMQLFGVLMSAAGACGGSTGFC